MHESLPISASGRQLKSVPVMTSVIKEFLKQYRDDRRGQFAVITCLALVPLIAAAGGAVDLWNARRVQNAVQNAVDTSALAAVSYSGEEQTEREKRADTLFLNNTAGIAIEDTDLSEEDGAWVYKAEYKIKTNFLRVVGIDEFEMESQGAAALANSPMDVVLVLDSSGSMAQDNRMVELKASVKLFLEEFKSNDLTQVALVPFDTQVKATSSLFGAAGNVSVANPLATGSCATISDPLDRDACYASQNAAPPVVDCSKLTDLIDAVLCGVNNLGFKVGTTAITDLRYISDRRYDAFIDGNMFRITRKIGEADCSSVCTWKKTYSTTTIFETAAGGGAPATSKPNDAETPNNDLIAQYPGPWPRCFVDRSQPYDANATAMNISQKDTIYPEAHCATGSLEPITGLTFDLQSVETAVNKLTPSGNTNVTIGVQWGMEALTAAAPLTGVRTGSEVRKVMIVLTDGLNTQNRWWGSRDRNKIDARTLAACNNAKAMGIELYTVRLVEGNEDLLKTCAETEDKYHYVTSASQLKTTFADLARQVKGVRLAW
ncbi:hypothetical protein FP2506_07676 [Fulvimarina pelagi HTCC2506]|uniref:VWFA domain-containing protein n=2 Tax=Fulvimarina pelagi TaxID=217511 RepID=Q0G6L1_9HYPH|nr:hypothetical protein FP2506_07676 [Fulvimarina pelagi HTCC2506]